jgi:hypothetical protein
MGFTDRYIKLPSKMVNIKEADMVGQENANQMDTDIYLNPMDISVFRRGMDDNVEQGNTVVELKSGEPYVIAMDLGQFVKTINDFMK